MFTKCFFCITNDNSSLYANLKPKLLFGYQQRSVSPAPQKYHGPSKISYRKLPPPTRARRTSQPIIGRHGFSSTPDIFAQNGVSPNHDTPRFTHSGFIAMSSSQTSSRWSHSKRSQRLSIVAHKLLCAEGDWHKEKVKLLREIKRLRSEVDLMVEMYNNSQLEVQGMVSRLKAQPPPPVPKRSTGHHHNENHEQTRTDHTNSISPEDEEMRRIRKHKKGKEKEGQRATNDDLGRWRSRNRSSHKANPNLTISVPAATPISPTTPSARYARGSRMRPKVDAQIRDDRHGNEKDRKFAEGIDKCAGKWDSMVRSFFKRLEEIEAGNEGEMYERYVGDEGWDFGVIEWAKTENVELTDVDKMCWRVRYLEGYKLIREGRRVVLIETGVF